MNIPLLVAIEPPREVSENIRILRKRIVDTTGNNSYGSHDPHITLLVSTFTDLSTVEREVEMLAEHHESFKARVQGIHTVFDDPVFKGNTLVYKLEKPSQLENLQNELIERLNPLRTDDHLRLILQRNPELSERSAENIRKYGHPYDKDAWFFHATIGTVPNEQYEKVWKIAQRYDLTTTWIVKSIGIYTYRIGDGFRLFKTYELK